MKPESPAQPCTHEHLDMDGICMRCGGDLRTGVDLSAPAQHEAPQPQECKHRWRIIERDMRFVTECEECEAIKEEEIISAEELKPAMDFLERDGWVMSVMKHSDVPGVMVRFVKSLSTSSQTPPTPPIPRIPGLMDDIKLFVERVHWLKRTAAEKFKRHQKAKNHLEAQQWLGRGYGLGDVLALLGENYVETDE